MRTAIPEKILKIIQDLDTRGNVSLTRLTVLKKWFEAPGRLPAFGLWLARRAAAENLHDRARSFHGEFQQQQWGPVRITTTGILSSFCASCSTPRMRPTSTPCSNFAAPKPSNPKSPPWMHR